MISQNIAKILAAAWIVTAQPACAADAEPLTGATAVSQGSEPDDGLEIGGSIRARYETLGGEFRPGDNANDQIAVLRTLVHAIYRARQFHVAAELQDSRAYGAPRGGAIDTSDVNAFELIQAYVGLDIGRSGSRPPPISVDLGRFTMDLGSRRLMARNSYRNTLNAFTGIRSSIHTPGAGKLTVFWTMPQVRLPDDKDAVLANRVKWDRESTDLTFWGGELDQPLSAQLGAASLSFFGLDENDRPDLATRNRHLRTADLRLYRKPSAGRMDWDFEGAYQFGSTRTSTAINAMRVPVAAGFVHAGLGYRWTAAWEPRVQFVFDMATGDSSSRSYGRFDTLYGARRFDFGPTGIYGALGRANIVSPGLQVEAAPAKRLKLMAMGRLAWLASATDSFSSTSVRDATGQSGRFAGQQIEAKMHYDLVPSVIDVELGGAVLFAGSFLENAPNANGYGDTRYGYAQIEAKF